MHFARYVLALAAAAQGCVARKHMGMESFKMPAGDAAAAAAQYTAYNFSVPIDHFHNDSRYAPHSNGMFDMRYWFDATFYKPGGPVIALMGGETSGSDRLPYLQKGIVYQLAKATNGVGVIVEHRYYGESFPVPDLSVKNLRFLTTDQSLADTSYFAQRVKFPGLEKYDLTSKNTPWIAWGGSYAGAYVSFLRKLYPDTWFGAISSSGVTKAQWDFHQYYDAIVKYGPQDCIHLTQKITNAWDHIFQNQRTNAKYGKQLKKLFDMPSLTYDDDFMYAMASGATAWQGLNWDPAVSSPDFYNYCGNISSSTLQFPDLKNQQSLAETLLTAGGYGKEAKSLAVHVLNWAGWQKQSVVEPITSDGTTLSSYFSQHNKTYFAQDDISQTWRSWPWQYCTQWGYIQAGSTTPKNQLSLVSRLITLESQSLICKYAFGLTTPAKTDEINKYGGLDLCYPRLAQTGGEADPWRPVTPLADSRLGKPSTTDEPRIVIGGKAVHHWDENGLFPNETTANLPPAPVRDAQSAEASFVKAWLKEWKH